VKYGENSWAAVRGYLDALADTASAPVIEKYKDVSSGGRRLHGEHGVLGDGVDPPRPRLRVVRAPVITGLERVVQAGGEPIGWVSVAYELQRDWAREDTVPGVVEIVLTERLLQE
jgi:hypothetical protein